MQLRTERIDHPSYTEIFPYDEVDIVNAPIFRQVLHKVLYDRPGIEVRVNGRHLEQIDSTALGVLIGSLKLARAGDGDVTLCELSPRVRKLFEITGLDNVFKINESPLTQEVVASTPPEPSRGIEIPFNEIPPQP